MVLSNPDSPEWRSIRELDFDDSLAESLDTWDHAGRSWNSKVQFLFHAASAGMDTDTRELELGQATTRYTRAFAGAAAAIAGEFIEKRAVPALNKLLVADDTQRRQALYSWYDLSHIPTPSAHFYHDLAAAYGDPYSNLQPIGSDVRSLEPAVAEQIYMANLDRQSDHILSGVRRMNHDRQLRVEHDTRTRKIARKAFGRYRSNS